MDAPCTIPSRGKAGKSRFSSTLIYTTALCCTLLIGACGGGPSFDNTYSLIDEAGKGVRFPDDYRGKTLLVSYIYTHCPDVCVMTTDGMERLRRRLGDRDDVMFVSITLDPRRDSSTVLRRYAELRGIDTREWHFLTGGQSTLDSLFDAMGVLYRKSMTQRSDDGNEVYFLDHSDNVTLIGPDGKVQGEYKGTKLDVEKVVEKIDEIS